MLQHRKLGSGQCQHGQILWEHGEDMAYGAVTSPAGDALLFSGVREVIDEEKQKLLEGKHSLQEVVKSRASAALGKLNFDACLPKRKDDK